MNKQKQMSVFMVHVIGRDTRVFNYMQILLRLNIVLAQKISAYRQFFFSGKDELTVLHASQCTALASCSSVMDKDQDKGWMTTIFEWLRRY